MVNSNYFPFNAAMVDMRFDQPDVNKKGQEVNSFEAVKPFIDHIKATGYDTVMFVTNVPVNLKTGVVDTEVDPGEAWSGPTDRGYPDDFWKMIEYAESIGLNTHLQLDIVDYLWDRVVTESRLPADTDLSKMFKSIGDYQVAMATTAQTLGVESINIGGYNTGLNDDQDLSYWRDNIDAIRKVFSGHLSYTADWQDTDKVLDLVDFRILHFRPQLADQHLGSVAELMLKYFNPDSGQGDLITHFRNLDASTDQPIVLLTYVPAVSDAPGTAPGLWYPWEFNGMPDWARKYLTQEPDRTDQLNQYRAFFEIIGDQLSTEIQGITSLEYAPWIEAEYYWESGNPLDRNYYVYHKVGSSLNPNWNPEAHKVIGEYASAEWGAHSIHLGTTAADFLTGSTRDDRFVWRGGSDSFDGKSGNDTVIVFDSYENWTISGSGSQKTLTKHSDVLNLIDIEQIQFLDFLLKPRQTFVGTDRRDSIKGTEGDDAIYGKQGIDRLYGGDGADQFVFDTITYTVAKNGRIKPNKNQDTIFDFDSREDILVFDTNVFDRFSNNADWIDNVCIGFANQDADDWLIYDAGRIYYDFNGSAAGGQSLVAQLIGSPALTFDNVMFI